MNATMILRMLVMCAFSLLVADSVAKEVKPFSLSMTYLQQLETRIKMPKGAKPISDYVRYYAVRSVKGQDHVAGIFIRGEIDRKPGIQIVENTRLPYVFDGGCGIIDFMFDVIANKITKISCHGEA